MYIYIYIYIYTYIHTYTYVCLIVKLVNLSIIVDVIFGVMLTCCIIVNVALCITTSMTATPAACLPGLARGSDQRLANGVG